MSSPAPRSVSPLRVLAFAAIIGIVAGVGLSFRRQAQAARELEAQVSEAERYEPAQPVLVPGAPQPSRLPQSVTLAAVEGLPQYPGAFVHPLSEQISGQGVEMNIAWFETKDSVKDVLWFYATKFKEAGKWGVAHMYSDNAGYVGYLDHDAGRMHLISALRQGGKTTVFPSLSYPGKMLQGGASPPPNVPTLAGAEGNMVFDFGDKQRMSKVWLTRVKQRALRDVVETYKQSLVEKGWSVAEKLGATDEMARVEAHRPGSGLQVEFKRDADATVAVYVTMLPDA